MNDRTHLLAKITRIAEVASGSHIMRLFFKPYQYITGIFFSKLIFPITKKKWEVNIGTFFGAEMNLALPAGLDIYILGAKSHHSEWKLAMFMIKNLEERSTFYDIGAHFGYFSLLASRLVGPNGKVVSFEASPVTFDLLHKNCGSNLNITIENKAVGDDKDKITFYEFPVLYSEFNSLEKNQYKNTEWIKSNNAREVEIGCVSLDYYTESTGLKPDMIKIDVEGGEYTVLRHSAKVLEKYSPTVIMEFIPPKDGIWENSPHFKAVLWMLEKGYCLHKIDKTGEIIPIKAEKSVLGIMDSENLVFRKAN
jgi:FkbM family methyltransferase